MGRIEQRIYTSKNGTEVRIRDAHSHDAESLIDINMKIVNERLYMMREPEEAIYTKDDQVTTIESLLSGSGSLYIVAEVGKKIAGYLDFRNGVLKRTMHSGVLSIYILKEYREMGIGKILLQSLINWAEKSSLIEKITLAVFSTNERAIGLYKKLGFIEEGRCPKDMKLKDGTYMDSVLMYKFVKQHL